MNVHVDSLDNPSYWLIISNSAKRISFYCNSWWI